MRALIAMSGGVDSSVAALLAQKAGYLCIGCTMRLRESPEGVCPRRADIESAKKVADVLGIEYRLLDFTERFEEKVIKKFVARYRRGITPNPCVDCNRYMKFGRLFRAADELGCDKVVTGHYVRVEKRGDEYFLKKALDPSKDQSYVLYHMTQRQLSKAFFPLGEKSKPDVRRIARRRGFSNAEKAESQDICFVPDGDYAKVLASYTDKPFRPGDFVTADGAVLGRHRGIARYTIGQRRGLGISSDRPLYVKSVDSENNRVILGHEEDLYSRRAFVKDVSWISGRVPEKAIECAVKVRYRRQERPAVVTPVGRAEVRIDFAEPCKSVTPGQSAVFYLGDRVLGGGEIVSRN